MWSSEYLVSEKSLTVHDAVLIDDVTSHGKRQKWNLCRRSSAVCTVDWKYLYLRWIVEDLFLRITRKEKKIRGNLYRLPSAVNVMLKLSNSGTSFCLLSMNYFCFTHVFCRSAYEEPSCREGFEEIVKVNFIPRFKNEKIKELYMQFL